jgi:hypothetical protein
MADPQREIAPIIEPAAPSVPAGAGDVPAVGIIAAVIVLLLVLAAVALWRWRQQAPLRALRKLPAIASPVAAADALAAIIRRANITLDAHWQADLARLRFGPPFADAPAVLARLCRDAEAALKPRR